MVSTRTRLIIVTVSSFIVTVAAEAGALFYYVDQVLHEPLVLASFRPWLAMPSLSLGGLLGVLGATVGAVVAVTIRKESPKTSSPPSTTPQAVTTTTAGQFPPKVAEVSHMRSLDDPFRLPGSDHPHILLTLDQAREIEGTVNAQMEEIAYLKDRLAIADELLGARTRDAYLDKISSGSKPAEPSPPANKVDEKPHGRFPLVTCERCGRKFEQTIAGRTKCPDCWALEEYISKPPSPPPPPVAPSAPVGVVVDGLTVAVKRLERAPNVLATLRYVGEHPGVKVVDVAKEMQLGRGTVSDRVNDLVRLGLLEKENGGFRVTKLGSDVIAATKDVQVAVPGAVPTTTTGAAAVAATSTAAT